MEGTPSKIAARFAETEVDGEVIIMRLSDGDIFSLTGTSREVWGRIDGRRSVPAIVEEFSARHREPRETVAADVAASSHSCAMPDSRTSPE